MPAAGEHWEAVWSDRAPTEVSWYQADVGRSLELITELAPARTTPIVDIGGGASILVDALLDAGYRDVTVLDISASALEHARRRIGARADEVTWVEADVLEHRFGEPFGIWHDRAAFHFLVDASDRTRYAATAHAGVEPDGYLIVATFGPDAPPTCSGLPVERYDAPRLTEVFGDGFEPVHFAANDHVTPAGTIQPYTYGVLRRR